MKKGNFLVMLVLLWAVTQGVQAQSLSFISHGWDEANGEVTYETSEISDYEELSGSHSDDWVSMGTDSKYVVTENATYKVLHVTGTNAHLYLCDGVTLNVKHVKLEKGYSLHIHAQSEDHSGVGKLIVNNDEYGSAAGIGSAKGTDAGDLYVHGGVLTVTGNAYAAGIGGGENGSCGNLYVYAGTVTANGGVGGAGIGGGMNRGIGYDCSLYIYGGSVSAYGNGEDPAFGSEKSGAGIGGGNDAGQGGAVNIYGGTVTAEANYLYATGIGGGYEGGGGVVNIHGGTVKATGNFLARGIGRGFSRDVDDCTLTITGGTVYALAGSSASGIVGSLKISNATLYVGAQKDIYGTSIYANPLELTGPLRVTGCPDYSWNFEDTPVPYADREKYLTASSDITYYVLKIEPCENHHYVNYTCAYCGSAYYESTTVSWLENGVRAESFSNMDESTKTITIESEAELGLLSFNISSMDNYEGWTIKLDKDLDMSTYRWGGIGTFSGIFDGQGHTISGLHYSKENYNDAGLLSKNTGTVKNVKLVNSVLIGDRYVGAIVSNNMGTVENCYVADDVSVIFQSGTNTDYACGGIVGIQTAPDGDGTSTVQGCYSEASVNGVDNVGGIVGEFNGGSLTDCVSKATVTATGSNKGILIGSKNDEATLTNNSYIAESVNENADAKRLLRVRLTNDLEAAGHEINYGGPVGTTYNVSGIKNYQIPYQLNVGGKWYVKDVDGGYFTFSLSASQPDYTYTYVTVNGNEKEAAAGEYTFDVTNDVTEYVVDALALQGEGTQESPYLIQSIADWNSICQAISKATDSEAELFADKFFKQTADIDIYQGVGVTGNANDKKFCGTYDGDGYRLNCILTNPVENSAEAVAPFHNTNGATIKNLYVTGSISGGIRSAGIVAYTHGDVTIDNCRVAAAITCTGDQWGDAHGAGFVGYSMDGSLTIKNSLFDGSLKAVPNGEDNIRLAAFADGGDNTLDIQYCVENGTYEGTTDDSQMAFCWKGDDSTTPDTSTGNIYVSDLGHGDGADKAVKVSSGTDGLELTFPDDCYDWQETYHGAMFKSSDDNAIAYLIKGQYYTIKSCVIQFGIEYPENWENVKVFNGETEISNASGHYSFKLQDDEDVTITATYISGEPAITLYDDSNINGSDDSRNNLNLISSNNGRTANVTISGRTLYKDNSWNTLCLPFDVTISGSVLDGADVRTLVSSRYDKSNNTLTLNFSESSLDAIEAGKPYIIKWNGGDDIVNPKFEGVTISVDPENMIIPVGEENVDPVVFTGSYMQSNFPKDEKGYRDILYMGADNKLYFPDGTADFTINCFRAYFMLQNDLTADDLSQGAKSIVLNFGDEEATGITFTPDLSPKGEGSGYYTLDGRRLSGKPSRKGVYINNGKKHILR